MDERIKPNNDEARLIEPSDSLNENVPLTAFEAFQIFTGIRLHFSDKEYDAVKYQFKLKGDQKTFNKRDDKLNFIGLAKKYPSSLELASLVVSNILKGKQKERVKYYLSAEAKKNKEEWEANMANILGILTIEISYLCTELIHSPTPKQWDDLFEITDGAHPLLLVYYYAGNLSLETMIILNSIYDFLPKWKVSMLDDIMWPETEHLMEKYNYFIKFNKREAIKRINNIREAAQKSKNLHK